jgi:hypothetical protein
MSDHLQFHYVVYAEVTDEGTKWNISLDTDLLYNGSVFDPSQPWGLGWRCVITDDVDDSGIDDQLVAELTERLNARIVG